MTSYYKLTSLNFFKSFISVILLFILCVLMWRLPYNCVLFTIWGLKLCSLKLPYLLRMCSFPRIVRKVMEFDFFGHGKSWKVMEFELPKRVWTLRDGDVLDSTARPAIAHGLRSRTACDRARPAIAHGLRSRTAYSTHRGCRSEATT